MNVKVDALMLKRLLMESSFLLLASLLIIIFAFPVKAAPIHHISEAGGRKSHMIDGQLLGLIVMLISTHLAYQVYVFLTFQE